ncbi:N-acetylmuramoyl-L-alanine amidase [Dellaglioa sp. P0083]|uniref:N-acetylmuramoyl-L-alanine amidase n=1 Tax=Dellaglioa kimchii TaxID=3344667 RepID=UPI0038D44EC6
MQKKIVMGFTIVLGIVAAGLMNQSVSASSKVNNYIHSQHIAPNEITSAIWGGFPTDDMAYRQGKPEGVVVHETANPSSTIYGEMAFMKANYGNAFVHSFVDDHNIINIAKTNVMSWGSGPKGNQRFVQFEETRVHSKSAFAREVNNAAYYTAYILRQYGLKPSLATASNHGAGATIWAHADVSKYLGATDHGDPVGYYSESGSRWFNDSYSMTDLYDLIQEYYTQLGVKVAYHSAAGSETVQMNNTSYRLYNHVKGTVGAVDKGSSSKLSGKTLYADMRGVKNGSTTWYRVRVKGTSTKYWIYSDALKLRKVSYSPMNVSAKFNGKSYQLHDHVYNSDYLSKKTGDSANYKDRTYTINQKAVITDYNGAKSTMYRIKIGSTNHWVYTGAVNKDALVNLEMHSASGSETAKVNSNKYMLYNSVKNSTDNTVNYGSSTQLTGQTVKLLARAENRSQGTTWYQIKSGSNKYWVYSKALTFNQSITYKALKQTATVSTTSTYYLHNHVYNSAYLSVTTGRASDATIRGKAVNVDCMATIKENGKEDSYMYRFTVIETGKTYWAYGSVLVGRTNS